jgi:hypothetical protein
MLALLDVPMESILPGAEPSDMRSIGVLQKYQKAIPRTVVVELRHCA